MYKLFVFGDEFLAQGLHLKSQQTTQLWLHYKSKDSFLLLNHKWTMVLLD